MREDYLPTYEQEPTYYIRAGEDRKRDEDEALWQAASVLRTIITTYYYIQQRLPSRYLHT